MVKCWYLTDFTHRDTHTGESWHLARWICFVFGCFKGERGGGKCWWPNRSFHLSRCADLQCSFSAGQHVVVVVVVVSVNINNTQSESVEETAAQVCCDVGWVDWLPSDQMIKEAFLLNRFIDVVPSITNGRWINFRCSVVFPAFKQLFVTNFYNVNVWDKDIKTSFVFFLCSSDTDAWSHLVKLAGNLKLP